MLRSELGATLGKDRFLRKITATANLRHPHILPRFDSGEAAGLLHYVMHCIASNGDSAHCCRAYALSPSPPSLPSSPRAYERTSKQRRCALRDVRVDVARADYSRSHSTLPAFKDSDPIILQGL